MKTKIKIVYNKNGNLISAIVRDKPCVTYSTKKYVKAPEWCSKYGYYLTVFKSWEVFRKSYLNFFSIFELPDNYEVWKVSVKGKVKLPPFLVCDYLEEGRFVLNKTKDWPVGTEMFKKVKLIERIL